MESLALANVWPPQIVPVNTWTRSRAEAVEQDLLVAYPVIDIRAERKATSTCYRFSIRRSALLREKQRYVRPLWTKGMEGQSGQKEHLLISINDLLLLTYGRPKWTKRAFININK